jgi:molybdopterin/thiamine biosynthesis adenylyltransferase
MVLVLLIALFVLALGRLMGLSRRVQSSLMAVLFLAVMVLQLTLPEGHGLRTATGGSAKAWMILGGLAALVLVYAAGVKALSRRAPAAEVKTTASGVFSTTELDRYARHIVLREIGGSGQQRLKKARVLVVGAGGLGSPALLYLAAAGIGTLGVIDDDEVSLSNLQRQVLHREDGIGMPKVFSAEKALKALNPHITIRPYNRRLTPDNARDLFADYDLILDGSDNFATRYLVNEVAVALGLPLIAAAISQWEGQISLYHPAKGGPCYACVFPQAPADGLAPSCAEAGVMGALPGVVGSMMAVEAIKFLTGAGETLSGQMLIYDALYGESRKLRVERRADCPVCASGLH